MAEISRVYAIAKGLVQGVGYRAFALHLARSYGLTGWIRNREDGTVELEVQGEEVLVRSFLKDLKIGPRSAEVEALVVEPIEPVQKEEGFHVRF